MIATLRQRNFALLWSASLVSLAGDWVLMVGMPIYVYLLTRSVAATAIMLLAAMAPGVLVGSFAGVFVDRWDRRRTMVVTNLLMALGLLPLLLVHEPGRVWIAYIVAVVESCVEQFFTPATNAVLPRLVGDEHLVAANSLASLNSNIARLIGPAFGGVVAGFFGLTGIVVADGLSFLLAALLIALISRAAVARAAVSAPTAAPEDADVRQRSAVAQVAHEWADGLRVIWHERTLSVLIGAIAIMALGEGVMSVLYPIFVYRVLHGGALQIGELMSAQAVGGLLGGVIFGWAGSRVMSRWVIGICAVLFGLIDLTIFNSPAALPSLTLPVFTFEIGLFVAVGIPTVGMSTGMQSLVQIRSPESHRGRVFGVRGALMALMMVTGTVIAGLVTDRLGVVTVLNIQGAGYVVAGMLMITLLPHRAPPRAALDSAGEANDEIEAKQATPA
ncbi:MAG: MFS transporter [Ktedonobacterales bacterium]